MISHISGGAQGVTRVCFFIFPRILHFINKKLVKNKLNMSKIHVKKNWGDWRKMSDQKKQLKKRNNINDNITGKIGQKW